MTNDELIRQAIAAEAEQAVDPGIVLANLRRGAKPRRRRTLIVTVAGGAVAAGIVAVIVPLTASREAAPAATSEIVTPPPAAAEKTVLLMGLDEINIPDTIVLAKLGADGSLRAVSVPRNTNAGQGIRLNSSYAKAGGGDNGAKAMVAQVEKLTGVRAEHYMTITMAGFTKMVTAAGGVQVCLRTPAKDTYSNANLPAGKQVVTGEQALAFIRQRHGLPQGDLDRIARHQALLRGLITKLNDVDVPAKVTLATTLLRNVQTDPGLDVIDFARRMTKQSSVALATVPLSEPTAENSGPHGYTLRVEPEKARPFTAGFLAAQPTTPPSSGGGAGDVPCVN